MEGNCKKKKKKKKKIGNSLTFLLLFQWSVILVIYVFIQSYISNITKKESFCRQIVWLCLTIL